MLLALLMMQEPAAGAGPAAGHCRGEEVGQLLLCTGWVSCRWVAAAAGGLRVLRELLVKEPGAVAAEGSPIRRRSLAAYM